MSLNVGSRALLVEDDKMINVFTRRLDKPDQTPPFSSSRSRQSEAFWEVILFLVET